MVILSKVYKYDEQQSGLPQGPSPPTSFALSLGPICLNSILVLYILARSLAKSLKSTLSLAINVKNSCVI